MVEVTKNNTASSQSLHTDVHTSPQLIHRQIPNNINNNNNNNNSNKKRDSAVTQIFTRFHTICAIFFKQYNTLHTLLLCYSLHMHRQEWSTNIKLILRHIVLLYRFKPSTSSKNEAKNIATQRF